MKLGIIANEFFDPALGRTGGFGWAARRAARVFQDAPELGWDVVFLSGEHWSPDGRGVVEGEAGRILVRHGLRLRQPAILGAWRERIDLLLAIDYRANYDYWLYGMARTPAIIWSRDPRTPADVAHVLTLRLPGESENRPAGIDPLDCTSLERVVHRSRRIGRKVIVAAKAPHVAAKAVATYRVPASEHILPNPDVIRYGSIPLRKAERPRVVFVGRLDPIKRPWLLLECARLLPDVDFLVLGRAHFEQKGGWRPAEVPPNVRLAGEVHGREKLEALGSAWVLVNTSIHEETPVSALEAFACEVPVVSCSDWGGLASRFGVFAGRAGGTGEELVPSLTAALRALVTDHARRAALGRSARTWVEQEHSTQAFLSAFARLCREAKVRSRSRDRAAPRSLWQRLRRHHAGAP